MARYIDADKVHQFVDMKVAEGKDGWANGVPYEWAFALTVLDNMPTLNVAIVKHGEWIDTVTGYACSICHTQEPTKRFLYCPHCGAKMDGRGDT